MVLHSISFGVVNAYLIRQADGDVLVDTGLPGMGWWLLHQLRRLRSGPERLRLIILTHAHYDHLGNLALIQRLSGAPVLAHPLEAAIVADRRVVMPKGHTPLARMAMAAYVPFLPYLRTPACPVELIAEDEGSLRPLGLDARVLFTPGHTAGSLSVLLPDGQALVGDLWQNGWGFGLGAGRFSMPLADCPEALAPSRERLLHAGATQFFPGHGRSFTAQEWLRHQA